MASTTTSVPAHTTVQMGTPVGTTTATPKQMAPAGAATGGVGGGLGGRGMSEKRTSKRGFMLAACRVLQLIFCIIAIPCLASAHAGGFRFSNFSTYTWLMVMLAVALTWAFVALIADCMEGMKSFMAGGLKQLIAGIVDLILAFLLFGASCSAATLDVNRAGAGPRFFSSRVRAATAFSFFTVFALIPSMLINFGAVFTILAS